MIYFMKDIQGLPESEIQDLLPYLSRERYETVNRYRFSKNRIQSALSYLLLRYGFIRDHQILTVPTMDRSEQGKPFLREYPWILFNISHCDGCVACGFSRFSIGVDVQHLVPYKESVAQRFMTQTERDRILTRDRDREFTRLWSLKESYGKFRGWGISYPMTEVSLTEGRNPEGCILKCQWIGDICLSVCGLEEQEIREISFPDLKAFFLELY